MDQELVYFEDENQQRILRTGISMKFVPPLYKGMKFSIHGLGSFEVVEWRYHWGHEDEDGGLTIVLRQA